MENNNFKLILTCILHNNKNFQSSYFLPVKSIIFIHINSKKKRELYNKTTLGKHITVCKIHMQKKKNSSYKFAVKIVNLLLNKRN